MPCELPSSGQYVPLEHSRHASVLVEPLLGLNVPAGHVKHELTSLPTDPNANEYRMCPSCPLLRSDQLSPFGRTLLGASEYVIATPSSVVTLV